MYRTCTQLRVGQTENRILRACGCDGYHYIHGYTYLRCGLYADCMEHAMRVPARGCVLESLLQRMDGVVS